MHIDPENKNQEEKNDQDNCKKEILDENKDANKKEILDENKDANKKEILDLDTKCEIIKKHKDKSRRSFFANLVLFCLAALICGSSIGFGLGLSNNIFNKLFKNQSNDIFTFPSSSSYPDNNSFYTPGVSADINLNDDYVSAINKVSKSVVAITTVVNTNENFFWLPANQTGSGSGIIFHEDTEKVYIVTNCHVINGADAVSVSVENSEAIAAKLVGKNIQADLAVISIYKSDVNRAGIENINIAVFGDSSSARVGEKIIAIGNALGEGNTVTSGIISAKDKKINIDGRELSVMQIDASINPGNSGGALIDYNGNVIGITTAKYAKFTVEGMAYSIASNDIKPVVEELMNEPNRPYLGITGLSITEELARNYNLPQVGVFINSVQKNSSAEKYGLMRGDVITILDGKSVYSVEDITNILREHKIGDKIIIHVMRAGVGKDLSITLEENTDSKF